jgi:hypothetical protein
MKNIGKKYLIRKTRGKKIFSKRKTMKGGIIYDFEKKTAELTPGEIDQIEKIKKLSLADHTKVETFINYLKKNNFDYDKIDETNKRVAYEILVSLISERSLH